MIGKLCPKEISKITLEGASDKPWANRIREYRLLMGWRCQRQLAEAINALDRTARCDGNTVSRWERGEQAPSNFYIELLCMLFDPLLVDSIPDAMRRKEFLRESLRDRRYILKALGTGVVLLNSLDDARELAADAARSSALLGASIEATDTASQVLTEARDQLSQLATDYVLASELKLTLSRLVFLRDHIYKTVVTRHNPPNQTRDLYMVLGAICVLLASISHDLSEPDAGMTQAATAETFARLSGDQNLLAWVFCTKAMIASWWSGPNDVLHHIEKAYALGAEGIPGIRLAGLQARALAQLGKNTEATSILNLAQEQRARVNENDELRELGEVFSFPLARQHYYNAATHFHLNNWAEVEHHANNVVELYGKQEIGEPWPVTLTLSRIYLAQARLQVHGPSGAHDALKPLFNTPYKQHLPQTVHAINLLHCRLQEPQFSGLSETRELYDAIRSLQSLR